MSISTQIARIETSRNTIRTKLIELGLATTNSKLDALATAVEDITNQGAVSATVQEGDTYTIPKGYHNGSGTVSGVAGGGNYSLQSKSIAPTKKQQNITPDSGYYGLSDVTVSAIPDAYQDVTSVTATAGDVLANKIIVTKDGTVTAGTMANNGAVNKTLDATTTSYTVPKGYHSGSGAVKIVTEEKRVSPETVEKVVTPTSGKVLTKVIVDPISNVYVNTDDMLTPVIDGFVLEGYEFASYDAQNDVAVRGTGTMPNNGTVNKALDTATTSYTIPKGYHSGSGKVSITTETKSATPTKSTQTISPTSGKVLSSVTVNPIPNTYQDVTAVTATATDVLNGKKIVTADGKVVTGSMANNGSVTATMDGLTVGSITVPAGYTSGGTISLTSDIETALSAI